MVKNFFWFSILGFLSFFYTQNEEAPPLAAKLPHLSLDDKHTKGEYTAASA